MIKSILKSKKLYLILYLFSIVVILVHMNGLFTDDSIDADPENLEMAYYLYTEGVMAINRDSTGRPIPTNFREPVPPIMNTIFMYINPKITKDASVESFKDGVNTKRIKKVNHFWMLILQLGVGYLTYLITKNKYLPFVSLFLVFFYFIRFGNHFDNLFTELPAAAIIIWCSIFFTKSLNKPKWGNYFLSGILMGLLILTKAKFFYLSIIILFPLIFFTYTKNRLKFISFIIIGTLFVVSPWLIRNYLIYGEINIVMRGGDTISKRVLFNQMEKGEIKGALYLWGPDLYKDLVTNTHLNVDPNEFEIGGKYEKISRGHVIGNHAIRMGMPEKAIDYHSKVRAKSVHLKHEYLKMGLDDKSALFQTHNKMKSESINWILMNPVKHFTMLPLFIWKSIWCFPNSTIPILSSKLQLYIHNIINLTSYMSIFILFIYGAIKRNVDLIALTLIPVVMLLFLVSVTHSLPRYTQPLIPSMLVSLVFMINLMPNYFLSQEYKK